MESMKETSRQRFVLLVIAFSAVFIYLHTYIGIRSRSDVKTSSIASHTSTEHHHHHHQLQRLCSSLRTSVPQNLASGTLVAGTQMVKTVGLILPEVLRHILKLQLREHGVVKVCSAGNFTDRVTTFNTFLSALRVEELTRRGKDARHGPTSNRLHVVDGARDDYLHLLSNHTNVTTVTLPWLTSNPGSPHTWISLQGRPFQLADTDVLRMDSGRHAVHLD